MVPFRGEWHLEFTSKNERRKRRKGRKEKYYEFILKPPIPIQLYHIIQYYRVTSFSTSFHNCISLLPQWESWLLLVSIYLRVLKTHHSFRIAILIFLPTANLLSKVQDFFTILCLFTQKIHSQSIVFSTVDQIPFSSMWILIMVFIGHTVQCICFCVM